jgi:osmotically-inducible protein OsmY
MATEMRTDEQIAADVRDALAWDSRLDASRVAVSVHRGEVTLSGVVARPSEVSAAAEDAWRIKGVRRVEPRLDVSPAATRGDSELATDLASVLRWDRRVDDRSIAVTVTGGVVALAGVVGSELERHAAEEDARHVAGVLDVVDELTISPTRQRSDAELVADVRTALDRRPGHRRRDLVEWRSRHARGPPSSGGRCVVHGGRARRG